MESKAKFAGHAIHPMLIVFPLGLLAMGSVFDGITLVTHNSKFSESAYYMIGAGIVTGLIAGVFGAIDYAAIPKDTRAKRIGRWHAIGNLGVLALFAGSFLLRRQYPADPPLLAMILSFGGSGLAMVTGWLGGELVEKLGVSVAQDANPDAPSSYPDAA